MKKFTKDEKRLFKGDGGTEGCVKYLDNNYKVLHRPNLMKMSSEELEKWSKKIGKVVSNLLPSVGSNHAVKTEYRRVHCYIRYIIKEVSIVDKDIIALVKKKRNISGNVCLDSVFISCGHNRKDTENVLGVEYY